MLLPDGRVQTVTYSVRPETGYVVRHCKTKLVTSYVTKTIQAEVTYSEGVICAPPPPPPGAEAAALPGYGASLPDYGRR